jgi:hypothetical protein
LIVASFHLIVTPQEKYQAKIELHKEKSVVRNPSWEERLLAVKAMQAVWLPSGILEALIALRIGLELIAAYPENIIVAVIYRFPSIFLWPFQEITISLTIGSVVLEIPSIFALLIYGLVAWVMVRIIWLIFTDPGNRKMKSRIQKLTKTMIPEDPLSQFIPKSSYE